MWRALYSSYIREWGGVSRLKEADLSCEWQLYGFSHDNIEWFQVLKINHD
jgi:hypothetical protein